MKVGDVIPLNIEDTIRPKCRWRAGDGMPLRHSNGQYALKVERFIAPRKTRQK
jgi:flagellar motor switch protein FliM